jgi:exopolyphosphatase/guanosine-5'-triphosphate,3'-diphosphate pyrophosphatase
MPADRPGRRQLRGDAVGWRAHQGDGEPAAGRGAAAAGVSAHDPPAKEDVARLKEVYRSRAEAGGAQAGAAAGGAGDCDVGDGGGAGEASVALELAAGEEAKRRQGDGVKRAAKKVCAVKRAGLRRRRTRCAGWRTGWLKMNNAQRAAVPGIGPRRSEIIVGGAQVYAALLERMGLKGFRYSPLGLRDGMLAQMLAEVDLRRAVHQKIEASAGRGCWRSAGGMGRPAKAEPVRLHVVQLFDQLQRCMSCPRSIGCGCRRRR